MLILKEDNLDIASCSDHISSFSWAVSIQAFVFLHNRD